jgi:hypothetical protein
MSSLFQRIQQVVLGLFQDATKHVAQYGVGESNQEADINSEEEGRRSGIPSSGQKTSRVFIIKGKYFQEILSLFCLLNCF